MILTVGILEPLHRLSHKGRDRSKAEALLAQPRVDRAGRDYKDPAIGATQDDNLTEVDVVISTSTQSLAESPGRQS